MIKKKSLTVYLNSLNTLVINQTGDLAQEVTGVTIDSRLVKDGNIFCAVRGCSVDGNNYIQKAIENGATVIVSEVIHEDIPNSVAMIQVSNDYTAVACLAAESFDNPSEKLNLLGITGTNGKTTCAFLLNNIMLKNSNKSGMIGTVQYSFGDTIIEADRTTPPAFYTQELLAKMVDANMDSVILEVSSHALDQHRLGNSRFSSAIFTNLSGDHLDYHETFEKYYQAKKLLFSEYLTPGSPAVINLDDEYGQRLYSELKEEKLSLDIIGVGSSSHCDAQICEECTGFEGSHFTIKFQGRKLLINSPLMGHFNVSNIAGCATLALALGIEESIIANSLKESYGAPGRMQPIHSSNGFVTFIDYAHTDDALKNVLQAVRRMNPKTLRLIFGCGGDRDRTKRPRMGKVAAEFADQLYLTSDNPRSEDMQAIIDEVKTGIPSSTQCQCFVDRREAIRTAIAEANPGDMILVAGKGHETYQIIAGVKHDFDDSCEVRKALSTLNILA